MKLIKELLGEGKVDRSGAQEPEFKPKGHRPWTAAEKRAWDAGDEMPLGTDAKNAAKRVASVLKDKSNYKIGGSGDSWAIRASEITRPDSPSAITLYSDKEPIKEFWFFVDGSWYDKDGKDLKASEVIKALREYPDSADYGWAETIFKPKAIKILMGK